VPVTPNFKISGFFSFTLVERQDKTEKICKGLDQMVQIFIPPAKYLLSTSEIFAERIGFS
jgi:hypothetical protein